jgi:hypothetical protein
MMATITKHTHVHSIQVLVISDFMTVGISRKTRGEYGQRLYRPTMSSWNRLSKHLAADDRVISTSSGNMTTEIYQLAK